MTPAAPCGCWFVGVDRSVSDWSDEGVGLSVLIGQCLTGLIDVLSLPCDLQTISPLSAGLFQHAIAQSGTAAMEMLVQSQLDQSQLMTQVPFIHTVHTTMYCICRLKVQYVRFVVLLI